MELTHVMQWFKVRGVDLTPEEAQRLINYRAAIRNSGLYKETHS